MKLVDGLNNQHSVSDLDRISAIYRDRLAVEVLAADHKEYRSRHVLVFAWSLSWETFLVLFWHLALLVVVSAVAGGHLTGENTWSNAVDADLFVDTFLAFVTHGLSSGLTDLDATLGNLRSEHPVQMNRGALAGVVCEVALRDPNVTGN